MKYICQVCGYVYDEASEACPFDQLPDSWQCPWCKAPKTQFKPEQAEVPAEAASAAADDAGDLKQLSPGQLAALCTNLARGCESSTRRRSQSCLRSWRRTSQEECLTVRPCRTL